VIPPPASEVLHGPVAALVQRCGAPTAAASRDDGQHVVFRSGGATLDAIVDDHATVHAIELTFPDGTPYATTVEGTPHRFVFGETTSNAARDELSASAETDGANFRTFRRDAGSDLVLVFDARTSALAHVIVGDRATLLRLGYVPDPSPVQQRFPYVAPVLRHTAVPDGSGPRATIVRVDVDRRGGVRDVAVMIGSGDPAFDAGLPARLAHDRYAPATLAGRAIAAGALREMRH